MDKSARSKLKFALFGNIYQASKSASIQKLLSILQQRDADVLVEKAYHDFLTKVQQVVFPVSHIFEGDDFDADFVISMGGDGTFLNSSHYVGDKHIPVLGINMGRLGFLANAGPEEMEEAVDALYHGKYDVEHHAMIEVSTDGEPLSICTRALNDIAVLKRDNASMISVHTSIDGEYLVTYQADGLIVSTPTGSTAYNLSNGGPIIVPQAGNLCLTAVAPHSLNIRPIVVKDESVVTLNVESRSHQFLIAVDGRSAKCCEGMQLTIRKAPCDILIVRRPGQSYFTTLR